MSFGTGYQFDLFLMVLLTNLYGQGHQFALGDQPVQPRASTSLTDQAPLIQFSFANISSGHPNNSEIESSLSLNNSVEEGTDSEVTSGNEISVFSVISSGSVSKETYESLLKVFHIGVYPLIIFLGSIGNIFSLITLFHQKPRDPITVYLMALSITDFLVMTFAALIITQSILAYYYIDLANAIQVAIFSVVYMTLNPAIQRVSAFLIVVLSIERTIAVCRPFTVKDTFLNRHPWKVVGLVYCTLLAFVVPNLFQYDPYILKNPSTNVSFVVLSPSAFAKATSFYTYFAYVAMFFTRVFPMVAVLVCNLITIISLKASERYRKRLVSHNVEELNVTRLLVTISAIFLICTVPGTVSGILTRILTDYGFNRKEHYLYFTIVHISSALDILNSAVNFVVYMFFSKRFRKTFYEVCSCCYECNRSCDQGVKPKDTVSTIMNG